MISITRTTPGGEGYDVVVFRNNYKVASLVRSGTARINKSKTLGGAVVVIHNGFVEGDRDMSVNGRLTEAEITALWDIFSTQTFVNIAIPEGVFDGVIKSLRDDNGQVSMGIEFKEKLTT
ncbi:MAG: hypothetical protein Q8P44_03970 [Dehalococcoidia bacterium]|nr:hypothetical protein [Dehalococcoidia bacterium]